MRADVMMMDVLRTVALAQGQVILLQVMSLLLLREVRRVKAFVEEVLLFSLSSTPPPSTTPSTRPAARCWAWGPKGLGLPSVTQSRPL